jgi:hypothetical protein
MFNEYRYKKLFPCCALEKKKEFIEYFEIGNYHIRIIQISINSAQILNENSVNGEFFTPVSQNENFRKACPISFCKIHNMN